MPTVMITGTSRGIGLEFVRQYAAEGWQVIAAARDPDDTLGLNDIGGDVRVVWLDVTNETAITEHARNLSGSPIDVLINNAGITGDRGKTFGNIDYDHWQNMLRVNVIAPVRVTEAFIGHLEASDQKKVICITSVVGSIEHNDTGGRYDYRSSKAALNMIVTSMNNDLRARGICVLALHPGWVQTEKNGPDAPVPLDESITGMRRVIAGLDRSTSGRFLNWKGEEYAW